MKKIIKFFIINMFIFSLAFAKVNMEKDILNFKELRRVERAIEKLENSKNIKVYLNIFEGENDFYTENPQKVLIFNIQNIETDELGIELKFSEDLNMEEKSVDLGIILDNFKKELYNREYEKYIIGVLEALEKVIPEEKNEDSTS
ncbi:MAG: hypothetical protein MR673_05460 [Fusobacterium perfoetens]|uniref:hypothetical protein n=1 Tax=Fusobacterium perfoetens TaxID=852 RepID=UPI0023F472CA|nr:hypothetical protein [Fusobacterium perfoetens]MCI6152559.1 hypothetical protein [Fusobacterium perfoetens]MDY3237567.1 hypothetical protein [Fusobacterium perfoetens]